MKAKSTIHAFPKPKWIETVSCDGKPCGDASTCGAGSTQSSAGNCQSAACGDSKSCDFPTLLSHFAIRHAETADVEIADYSSLVSIEKSVAALNRILQANGEALRATLENLDLVFSQIAPILAIDGVLAFVGKTPSGAELIEALEAARRTGTAREEIDA